MEKRYFFAEHENLEDINEMFLHINNEYQFENHLSPVIYLKNDKF